MDLDLVKKSTLKVLSEISDNELTTVTLPILREKVAEAMGLPIEELLGKEKKTVILETFQEFLLSKSEEKSSENGNSDDSTKSESEKKIPIKSKKSKMQEFKESDEIKKTKKKPESPKKKREESAKSKSSSNTSPSKSSSSAKSLQIEKLKSYVYKCGVRKVWKKELDGLNENQCIAKIQGILRELGIEGKPSLEQCKAIKERREFEAELREIDTSNIIEGKRRRGSEISVQSKRKQIVMSSESEFESEEEDQEEEEKSFVIDLKNFGDSESD